MGRPLGRGSIKSTKRAGRRVYIGRWTGADGQYHREILATDKRLAERRLADIIRQRDLALQGLAPEVGQELRLREVCDQYLAELGSVASPKYTERSRKTLDKILAFLGPTTVRALTKQRVLAYRRKRLLDGVSHRTCNMEVGRLKTCLKWATEGDLIGANPLAGLRQLPVKEEHRRKKRHAMTDEEIGHFRAAARQVDEERAQHTAATLTIAGGSKGKGYAARSRRLRVPQAPLWDTMLQTGLRWGEAATLRWADVDFEGSTLTVRASVAKSGRSRTLPFGDSLAAQLEALRRLHRGVLGGTPGPGSVVFLTPEGVPLSETSNNALRLLYQILKRAGLPKKFPDGTSIDIHSLRTTCGTRWAREGVLPPSLQYLMGHKDIATTMDYYVFIRMEDARRDLAKVPSLPLESAKKRVASGGGSGVPCTKPARRTKKAARHAQPSPTEVDAAQGLGAGGPCRTRTYDQAIMSRLL